LFPVLKGSAKSLVIGEVGNIASFIDYFLSDISTKKTLTMHVHITV